MNLSSLLSQNKLISHKTSKKEINDLVKVIERDLKDSEIKQLSADRRFITAYNAALQSTTIILYLNGYKVKGEGHHYYTFIAGKEFVDNSRKHLMDYFNACRNKRNLSDYDRAGIITDKEVDELINEANEFFKYVIIEMQKGE